MRVVAILLLAVAASAVSLGHKDASMNHLEQKVAKTTFGATVLAQIQSKISTGAPVDELKSIIAEIRTRLTEAQSADDGQMASYKTQCEAEVAQLNKEIADLEAIIAGLELDIQASKNEIIRLEGEIVATEKKIAFDESEIVRINDELDANEAQWNFDHATFINRTHDTNLCLEAIAEIKAIPGIDEVLSGNQDQTAADYQNDNIYTGLLETAAKKVGDASVKSFVELTAAAISQLSKGDVDSLKKLLDDLETDLQDYLVELENDDKANEKAYQEKKSALYAELAIATDTLEADKLHLEDLQGQLSAEQAHLAELERSLASRKKQLADTEALLAATEQKCRDLKAAYDERSSDRVEEQNTLDEIERIIMEKLGGAPEHISAAVADVSVAE